MAIAKEGTIYCTKIIILNIKKKLPAVEGL
jgi:hypothetical protein